MRPEQEALYLTRQLTNFPITDTDSLIRYLTLVECLQKVVFKIHGERNRNV